MYYICVYTPGYVHIKWRIAYTKSLEPRYKSTLSIHLDSIHNGPQTHSINQFRGKSTIPRNLPENDDEAGEGGRGKGAAVGGGGGGTFFALNINRLPKNTLLFKRRVLINLL